MAGTSGRDILVVQWLLYLLGKVRQALEDTSTRAEVNTFLGDMGLHYGGHVKVKHFAGIH